jgi:hypothetical protein
MCSISHLLFFERTNLKKVNTEKATKAAQSIVLVYSTMSALHGIITYSKMFGLWVDEKFSRNAKPNLHVIKGEDNE